MSKALLFLFTLSFTLVSSTLAEDSAKSIHPLSPVYEEMLANLTHSLNPMEEAVLVGFDSPRGIHVDLFSVELKKVDTRLQDHTQGVFVLVRINGYMNRGWLESVAEDAGFKIERVMAERELEFVEDVQGRQAAHLDMPEWRAKIHERLVREGMNPVSAYSATDQAISNFRKSESVKILILSKLGEA